MSIRNKLYSIGLLVIIILLVVTSYLFIISYKKYIHASGLQTILKTNAQLSNALRDIGKERGLTAMYLGNKKKEFLTSLNTQRVHTDTSLSNLTNSIKSTNIYGLSTFDKWLQLYPINTTQYERLLDDIKQIDTIRQSVNKNVSPYSIISKEGYTRILTTPILNNLLQIKHITPNRNITSLIGLLEQLYIAKENTGLERDLLTYYLMKQQTIPAKDIKLLETYTSKSNIFNRHNLGNPKLQKDLNALMSSPDASKILKDTSTMLKQFKTIRRSNNYVSNAINWFTKETKKITLLSKAELIVSNTLWKNNEAFLEKQTLILLILGFIALLSILLIYLGYQTIKNLLEMQSQNDVHNFDEHPNSIEEPRQQTISDKPFMHAFETITNGETNRTKEENHIPAEEKTLEAGNNHNYTNKLKTTIGESSAISKDVIQEVEKDSDFFTIPDIEDTPIIEDTSIIKEKQNSTQGPYFEKDIASPNKKILIAKKFLLSRNVLAQVLDNLGYEYTASAELSTLIDDINSNQYDIVFTDDDYLSENIESEHTKMMIITSQKSKDEIAYLINKQRS